MYLTFDDGPHEAATPFVLDVLKQHDAKGSFFCIGKNVVAHPELYRRIREEGHAVGNHTYNHLNGWKTENDAYLEDVAKAAAVIDSGLFRPPYGRISRYQARHLSQAMDREAKLVMWSVLSGDFDPRISGEQCLRNVLRNVKPGSVVVFHDSAKAMPLLEYTLPRVCAFLVEKGYRLGRL